MKTRESHKRVAIRKGVGQERFRGRKGQVGGHKINLK
jgi:hypothetical protein